MRLRLRRLRGRLRGRGAAREDRRDPRAAPGPAHDHRDRPVRRARPHGARRDHARARCASAAARAIRRGAQARRDAVAPEDPFTFIYTSGTTGPPKGCVLTHGNYRAIIDMVGEAGEIHGRRGRLPLPPARALLRAADPARVVRPRRRRSPTSAATPSRSSPSCCEVKPTYLPSVPRVFEKIYTLAHGAIEAQPPEEQAQAEQAIALGVKVRDMKARGEEVPDGAAEAPSTRPTRSCSRTSARSSAATCARRPAAPRRSPTRSSSSSTPAACPVLEGYGMTETATAATVSTRREPPLRHRRARAAGRRAEDRRRRRDPRSKARTSSRGYHNQAPTQLRRGRGRLAAHRRPRLDRRGRLPVDHRPQEGHHHHRRRQEPHAGQHRERPQAVPLDLPGRDARRPAPLPGRADHARRGGDRRSARASTACPSDIADARRRRPRSTS